MNNGFLSVIPILVCFGLILLMKNAFIAIGGGIATVLIVLFKLPCGGHFV